MLTRVRSNPSSRLFSFMSQHRSGAVFKWHCHASTFCGHGDISLWGMTKWDNLQLWQKVTLALTFVILLCQNFIDKHICIISISFYEMDFFSSFFPWTSPISLSKMEVICRSLKSWTILRKLRFLPLLLIVTLFPVLSRLLLAWAVFVSRSLFVFWTEFCAVLAALIVGRLLFV